MANRRIVLRTRDKGEIYYVYLAESKDEIYPKKGPPKVTKNNDDQVTATLYFHPETSLSPENIERTLGGAFRSALRAGVLSPLRAPPDHPPGEPFVPSYLQRQANAGLMGVAIEAFENKKKGPVKSALMMPGAGGKTVVVAKYADSVDGI